jgi:hypothetical protein
MKSELQKFEKHLLHKFLTNAEMQEESENKQYRNPT